MLARLALFVILLSLVAAGCGGSARSGRSGLPPLAPQDQWVDQRVEAVLALYSFTEEGQAAIRRMRVLHMLGRPGWFGSTGYENFVGIGQSRPSSVVHEMSHSFWGAFPIVGRPELSWKAEPGEAFSPGIQALRRDLDTFMQQPPDGYEPLRARLRLIPDLVTGGFPGLYHLGEADTVHFTGANLNLVPPILHKYFSPWLPPGAFQSWDEAVEGYLKLPPQERRIANAFTGVGGMPLEHYTVEVDLEARVEPSLAAAVAQEERQRLIDFVEQFDLYFKPIDGPPVSTDFRFWRGYLRDMATLSGVYPEVLDGEAGQARLIKEALRFLLDVDSMETDERADFVRGRLTGNRFLLKFAPALDHRTLAELISSQGDRLERRVAALLEDALEPDHLQYLAAASQVLAEAMAQPEEAARAFQRFIGSLDEERLDQMNFILELFRGVDDAGTRRLLTMISPETALLVMKEGPAYVRFSMEPEELVSVLGFEGKLTVERLTELSRLFNDHVAGTRSVDEPFLDAVYRRIIELGEGSPGEALEVFSESGLLVEPFLVNFPREASALVSTEPVVAAEVFRAANPVRLPPARAIYRLVQADPAVAARLTLQYEQLGDLETVQDALVFFAYDAPRLRRQPGLPISLDNNGRFLAELLRLCGEAWLRGHLAAFQERHQAQLEAGEADGGFLGAYRETVRASLATLEDEERRRIEGVVADALG